MKKLVPLTLALALGLTACGTAGQNPAPAASPTPAGDVQSAETPANTEGFPFTLTTKDGAEVTFTHVPEKVIAANGNAGDQLMALGLGDKIIATAYTNSDINPKWDAEYKAIPEAWRPSSPWSPTSSTAAPARLPRSTTPSMTP